MPVPETWGPNRHAGSSEGFFVLARVTLLANSSIFSSHLSVFFSFKETVAQFQKTAFASTQVSGTPHSIPLPVHPGDMFTLLDVEFPFVSAFQ